MSVEALGTDLLGEVNVEGLDEVWRCFEISSNLHQYERLTLSRCYARYES